MYSGEGGARHAALAVFTTESRRCGIFLRHSLAIGVPLAGTRISRRAARRDIGHQAGQAADAVQYKPAIAADLASGRFGQNGAAEELSIQSSPRLPPPIQLVGSIRLTF